MRRLVALYDGLIEGLISLAGLTLGAVCLLIVWDVVARNLGLSPPESTVALTEYALLYVTMAAAPALVRRRGHVVVEILHQRLPTPVRRRLDRLIAVFCAAIAFLVAGLALALAVEGSLRGELDIRSLDVPRALLFAPLVVGFGLMGSEFLRLTRTGTDAAAGQRAAL